MSLKGPDLKGVDSETETLRYIRHPYYLNYFSTARQGYFMVVILSMKNETLSLIRTRKVSSLILISFILNIDKCFSKQIKRGLKRFLVGPRSPVIEN